MRNGWFRRRSQVDYEISLFFYFPRTLYLRKTAPKMFYRENCHLFFTREFKRSYVILTSKWQSDKFVEIRSNFLKAFRRRFRFSFFFTSDSTNHFSLPAASRRHFLSPRSGIRPGDRKGNSSYMSCASLRCRSAWLDDEGWDTRGGTLHRLNGILGPQASGV